jgi:hypothetical protein
MGLLFSLLSCNDENSFDCFKSTGPTVVQHRITTPFNYIILEDNIDLYLNNETSVGVIVEGGKNLLRKVEIKNSGDSILISNKNQCNWVRNKKQPIKVTLGVKQEFLLVLHRGYGKVESVAKLAIPTLFINSIDAGGNVILDTKSTDVTVYSNSAAHIKLSGEADSVNLWLNKAIGRISAENLQAGTCQIRHSGNNEIRVFPLNNLEAEITESGTVAYYHEPSVITSTIKGRGKLVKR